MNRKQAREEVYKLIFGYLFTQENDEHTMTELENDENLDSKDMEYIHRTYNNVVINFSELCEIITKYAKGYTFERIFKPDLAGLLLAIAEMKYDDSIPLKVSITEVVDIVKRYSMAKSNSFVNGVLASVYREIVEEKNELN